MKSTSSPRLNEAQLTLLRLFDRGMTQQEIDDLKRVLLRHYGDKLQTELEGLDPSERLREVSEQLEQGSRTEVRQRSQPERGG